MKKKSLFIAIMCLIAVAYVVLIYLLKGFTGHGIVFWFSFACELFSIVFVTLIFLLIAMDEKFLRRAIVLGYSLARWAVFYLVAELALSTIFIIVDRFPKTAIILQFLLLVAFLVLVLLCRFARNSILSVQEERKSRQFAMKNLTEEAQILRSAGFTGELGAAVDKLCEDLKYSDTMSAPETEVMEERMLMELTGLKSLGRKDPAAALDKVNEIQELLERRNVLARSSKRRY